MLQNNTFNFTSKGSVPVLSWCSFLIALVTTRQRITSYYVPKDQEEECVSRAIWFH